MRLPRIIARCQLTWLRGRQPRLRGLGSAGHVCLRRRDLFRLWLHHARQHVVVLSIAGRGAFSGAIALTAALVQPERHRLPGVGVVGVCLR